MKSVWNWCASSYFERTPFSWNPYAHTYTQAQSEFDGVAKPKTEKLPIEALYYWIFSVIKYLLSLCRLAFCNLFLQSEDYPLLRTFLQTFSNSTFWYIFCSFVNYYFIIPIFSHHLTAFNFFMYLQIFRVFFFCRFFRRKLLKSLKIWSHDVWYFGCCCCIA